MIDLPRQARTEPSTPSATLAPDWPAPSMADSSVAPSSDDEYDSDIEFPAWQDPPSDSEDLASVFVPQSSPPSPDAESVKAWSGPNPLGKNQYSSDPQSKIITPKILYVEQLLTFET